LQAAAGDASPVMSACAHDGVIALIHSCKHASMQACNHASVV
jgi:hypothetical protein